MPDSARPDPPAGSTSARSLAEAVSDLKKATDVLTGGPTEPVPQEPSEATPRGDDTVTAEREQYYRHLEERGTLRDVDEDTDLSSLPSTVTHVRHPDGHVERLGYS